MKCFYHSADLDGHASGAIVKQNEPGCEMIGIDYKDPFPWNKIEKGEEIFMVDFCLQPFDLMEELDEMCKLIWIDHHKTALDEAKKRNFHPSGRRSMELAGCELTWLYFNADEYKSMPRAIQLLGRYDVWDHSDPDVLPFQMGMRANSNTRPENQELWMPIIHSGWSHRYSNNIIAGIIVEGTIILNYQHSEHSKYCKSFSFETILELKVPGFKTENIKAVALNRGAASSQAFEAVWHPDKYDIMLAFCRTNNGKWSISIYSTKESVDCGSIAKHFGGGGHKGAAGFQCDELPFKH